MEKNLNQALKMYLQCCPILCIEYISIYSKYIVKVTGSVYTVSILCFSIQLPQSLTQFFLQPST